MFQLQFIYCTMVSPFFLHCFPFSFIGDRKGIAEEVSMNYMAYTYYIMLIAKCMCTWLHHLLKVNNRCWNESWFNNMYLYWTENHMKLYFGLTYINLLNKAFLLNNWKQSITTLPQLNPLVCSYGYWSFLLSSWVTTTG